MKYPVVKKEARGLAKKDQRTAMKLSHASIDDAPLCIAIPTDQAQKYLYRDKVSSREAHWHRTMTPLPSQTLLGDLLQASKMPVQDGISHKISRKRHAEDEMQNVNPAVSDVMDLPLEISKRRCTPNAQAKSESPSQPLLPAGNQPHLKEVGIDLKDLRAQIQHLRLVSVKENKAQATIITNLLTLASVVEIAVDVREAELRTSLSNPSGTVDKIKEQAAQLVDFSSGTSCLVTSLVRSALEKHHTYLEDEEQQEIPRRLYEDAAPNEEDAAIINEQLPLLACGFGVE